MTWLRLDKNDDAFYEVDEASADYNVPDAEWAAYKIMQNKQLDLEDRWLRDCAVEDEFSSLRGVLSDEEIRLIKTSRSGRADPPSQPAPNSVEGISAEEAARRIIASNRGKCEHRHQVGPYPDGTIRCRDNPEHIIIRNAQPRLDPRSPDAEKAKFHDPGKVNPRDYEGTV